MPPISWASKWRWPRTRQARLADQGERLDQQVLEGLPVVQPLAELDRHGLQLLVGARLHLRLEGVDQRHQLGQPPDLLALAGAEDFREHAHGGTHSTVGGLPGSTGRRAPAARPPGARSPPGPSGTRAGPAVVGRRRQAVRTFRKSISVGPSGGGAGTGRRCGPWSARSGARASRRRGRRRPAATWPGGPGPDGVPVAGHHHLAALPIGDPRIVLLREVDLGPLQSGTVLADVAHLLLGQGSNLVGHDLPTMRDDYVHCFASSASLIGLLHLVAGPPGRSVKGWERVDRERRAADLVFDPTLACGGSCGRAPAAPTVSGRDTLRSH